MRRLQVLGITCAAALVIGAGCGRNDNSSTSNQPSDTTASASQDRPLTPTSRDDVSRRYADSTNGANTYDANNTGRNKRDRSDASLTAGDQGGSEADRQMTSKIRKAITDNDQFSADAKNVKVITQSGKVTLRGPVNNEQEKSAIANLVQQAGASSVDNQLEVKATQTNK